MTVAEQIGSNLRRVRRRASLNEEELARSSGIHRTEIGFLERGGKIPRLDTCIRLPGGTNVDARELIEGVRWRRAVSWGENGWIAILGLVGPVDLWPDRLGGDR
jgi:transcriptional regulator with XRE-family HTH domain